MVKPDNEIDVRDELNNETPFMYVFVREDLPPVVKLIQAAHVTHEAGVKFGGIVSIPENKKEVFEIDTNRDPVHFCIFGVKNEQALESIAWRLQESGFSFEMFHEPDYDIGHTAIAVEPLVGMKRDWFKKFKLLKM